MKAKKKSKLSLIDKFFLWINCGLCLALLISYLAPITDPRKVWIFAFFGLAYLPLLLGNLLLILYWLLRRNWLVLISVIGIIIGFGIFKSNVGLHPGSSNMPKSSNPNAIRLMTYNVHSFRKYGAGKDISTKHEILNIIADKQPDVIGIQEYFSRPHGQFAMTDSIKRIMVADNFYIENFSESTHSTVGIAIFSKYPIINKGVIQLSPLYSGNQCLYVDIRKGNNTIRLYSVHLESIKFDPEDYRYLDTVTKDGKPDLTSTRRLGGKLKRAFLKRAEQVDLVKQHAKQCPYPYLIAGDFNDTPASYAVNQMEKGMKNAFIEKGFGLSRTYNGDFPNYQIDYIMASPRFEVDSYTVIKKKLSDHFPVYADLLVK